MSAPITPQQKRAAETKSKIEVHALAHLEKVGIRSFSTSVIARNAGVSVGVIYRYFADSEALIEAVAPGAIWAWKAVSE